MRDRVESGRTTVGTTSEEVELGDTGCDGQSREEAGGVCDEQSGGAAVGGYSTGEEELIEVEVS